jgi:hypothetical protein
MFLFILKYYVVTSDSEVQSGLKRKKLLIHVSVDFYENWTQTIRLGTVLEFTLKSMHREKVKPKT